jgi:hypothetical protein
MKITFEVPNESHYETIDLLDNAVRYCLARANLQNRKKVYNTNWLNIGKSIQETLDWVKHP